MGFLARRALPPCACACAQVGLLTRNGTSPALAAGQALLQDGGWHMLTLSTLFDGTPGYVLFIDGALAAEIDGNQSYYGALLVAACLGSAACIGCPA